MKQKFIALFLGVILTMNLGIVAYARDTNWSDGSSFSWSPDLTYSYVSQASTYYLYVVSEFEFDSTAASQNNSLYYFTMEHNAEADWFTKDSLYSSIPDPHFDWDDDDSDGYHEEAEVSIEADGWKDMLKANYEYNFGTWWKNTKSTNSPSGKVYFVAQRSILNPLNGEYEAYHYDLLKTKTHPAIPHQ